MSIYVIRVTTFVNFLGRKLDGAIALITYALSAPWRSLTLFNSLRFISCLVLCVYVLLNASLTTHTDDFGDYTIVYNDGKTQYKFVNGILMLKATTEIKYGND